MRLMPARACGVRGKLRDPMPELPDLTIDTPTGFDWKPAVKLAILMIAAILVLALIFAQ